MKMNVIAGWTRKAGTIPGYLKFACIYCGQHMECKTSLSGRQMQCPACCHRIVIPPAAQPSVSRWRVDAPENWDEWVPMPVVTMLSIKSD